MLIESNLSDNLSSNIMPEKNNKEKVESKNQEVNDKK